MKLKFNHLTMAFAAAATFAACQPQKSDIRLEHQGDTLTIVHITNPTKYLILPIQESCNEGKVKLDTGSLFMSPSFVFHLSFSKPTLSQNQLYFPIMQNLPTPPHLHYLRERREEL